MPTLLIAFFGSSHADDVVVVNCFSKMMMAAGAESPAVATQSAKTDILQKIEEQRGNNHEHEQELTTEEELEEENEEVEVPKTHSMENIVTGVTFKFWALFINFEQFWTIFYQF